MTPAVHRSPFVSLCSFTTLLLAPCALLQAAPPPELTVLRTQYDKVVAERVTAPFEASLGELNTKFSAALENAAAEAKKSGSLPAVLAIEEDKKRIADKQPLPDADDDQTPDSLKKLRAIYREQFKKLDEQRVANHQAILPAYTAKLQTLETTLTKADRVEEAKEVMTYREGLAGGTMPVVAPSVASEAAKLASKTSGKVHFPKPSSAESTAASRTLAEWALNNGYGLVLLRMGGKEVKVATLAELPKEKFDLLQINFPNKPVLAASPFPWPLLAKVPTIMSLYLDLVPPSTISASDLSNLAAAPDLRSLNFNATKEIVGGLTIADLPFMPSVKDLTLGGFAMDDLNVVHDRFPSLDHLAIRFRAITPDELRSLRQWPELFHLRLDYDSAELTAAHVEALASLPKLSGLKLYPGKASIDPSIAKLKNLRSISVGYGCTADSFRSLCAIPQLTTLDIGTKEPMTDADLALISQLKELKILKLYYLTGCTDALLEHLSPLKNIEELSISDTPLTDAALTSLAKMKKLKKLSLKSPQITPEALARFKKQRPDVKVE